MSETLIHDLRNQLARLHFEQRSIAPELIPITENCLNKLDHLARSLRVPQKTSLPLKDFFEGIKETAVFFNVASFEGFLSYELNGYVSLDWIYFRRHLGEFLKASKASGKETHLVVEIHGKHIRISLTGGFSEITDDVSDAFSWFMQMQDGKFGLTETLLMLSFPWELGCA